MQYRAFGKTGFEASALGFGAMRLPSVEKDGKKVVDEAASIALIRRSIDAGVNYVDTAYPYHDGLSEVVVGKALEDGYREKVKLATKMPCWLIESYGDFDRYLGEQLSRLQVERVDYYLLHALWRDRWDRMRELKALEWAGKAMADGRIGALGFSFHGDIALFREVLDAFDWPLCQIQYNFMNEDIQAGTEGLRLAASRGIAVVVMEPLLGGLLANPPPKIKALWEAAGWNPVDAALQWLWDKAEVSTVLSGMSSMSQLEGNLASAEASRVGRLGPADAALYARVKDAYASAQPIPCTKCAYCMPCPSGVDIPRNFELYNQGKAFEDMGLSRSLYNWHFPQAAWAKNCTACKACEEKCPQRIPISEWMPKVHEALVFPAS